MKKKPPCPCQCQKVLKPSKISKKKLSPIKIICSHLAALILWWLVYTHLQQFSTFITYTLLPIQANSRLGSTLEFFFYDTPKVFMLLALVVYAVGLLRSFITPEKTRQILAGKSEFIGNILAACLGIITPFCSCSAVPLFIGFLTAGIPIGVTFSFLISAPMVNEIALVLLYGLLGWKIAALYLVTGLSVAIIAGFIIGKTHPEKYLENWVKKVRNTASDDSAPTLTWRERIVFAKLAVEDIFAKIWFYVLLGIALGAIIHGYVPESFFSLIMGAHSWWSVPLAVLLGIPLYSNAAGIVPVVEALIGKGAAIGTVLAFMMSVIALSLPEMLILRKVLKVQLIYIFLGVVTLGIVIVGYLFNWLI
ncbi:MAG: permease [Gammaproteobacteria bacterium]